MSSRIILTPVILLTLLIVFGLFSVAHGDWFSRQEIRMCLRPDLVEDVPALPSVCPLLCMDRGDRCRGFQTLADSPTPCRLFKFDKCSHEPNVANCSNATTWAFVREQPGLPLGRLCPEGFAYDRLGSKYRVIAATNWTDGLTNCTAGPGQLVKYSDGWNKAEVDHMHWIKQNLSGNKHMFVGGQRLGALATDVWSWVACGDNFKPEVWGAGQPDYSVSYNKSNLWASHTAGLDDTTDVYPGITAALCECLDPFY